MCQPFPPGAAVAAAANAGALASWMAAAASGASTVQAAVVTPASIPMPQNQGWFVTFLSSGLFSSYLFYFLLRLINFLSKCQS